MNFNSTVTSSVSPALFKRDYFTTISFNILKMKRCDNKLTTKRRKCVENVTEEEGITSARGLCIAPSFELYHALLKYWIYYVK